MVYRVGRWTSGGTKMAPAAGVLKGMGIGRWWVTGPPRPFRTHVCNERLRCMIAIILVKIANLMGSGHVMRYFKSHGIRAQSLRLKACFIIFYNLFNWKIALEVKKNSIKNLQIYKSIIQLKYRILNQWTSEHRGAKILHFPHDLPFSFSFSP